MRPQKGMPWSEDTHSLQGASADEAAAWLNHAVANNQFPNAPGVYGVAPAQWRWLGGFYNQNLPPRTSQRF